jgi:AcrR family transcriptional regulator
MNPAKVGRRRGKDLEQAIYEAVWEELHEVGFARLTMDSVAKRAGTSKPVLYRRWRTRAEMVVATAKSRLPDAESIPDTGSLRGDGITLLKLMRERMSTIGRLTILGMLAEIAANPEADEGVAAHFLEHMRTVMVGSVLARAEQRGELVAADIPPRLVTVPLELARNEFLVTGAIPDESIEAIVDQVFIPALKASRRPANPS